MDPDDTPKKTENTELEKSCISTMPETEQPATYEPKRGPFDFDMKSVWQRDAEDKESKEKIEENGAHVEGSPGSTKEELPAGAPRCTKEHLCAGAHKAQQPTATKESHGGNSLYFSPMPDNEKNEPVNFSKLMSGGYGDEWLHQRDEWDKKNSQPNDSETSQSESTQTDNE